MDARRLTPSLLARLATSSRLLAGSTIAATLVRLPPHASLFGQLTQRYLQSCGSSHKASSCSSRTALISSTRTKTDAKEPAYSRTAPSARTTRFSRRSTSRTFARNSRLLCTTWCASAHRPEWPFSARLTNDDDPDSWRFTHERRDGENEPDYATPLLDSWHRFIDQLPPDRRRYSPIFVEATGIHYQWDFNATLAVHISPFIRNTSALIPRPIPFFSGYPAVPPNKPVQWLGIQGPEVTQKYNREMLAALEEVSPEGSIDGGWTMLQWYNVTDGAVSYDGTHYDYQVR